MATNAPTPDSASYATNPFRHDPDFVKPSQELQPLERAFAQSGIRTALVGPTGVGKSQLVIETYHKTNAALKYSSVYWVGAETRPHLLQGLKAVAEQLGIRDQETTEANLPELVAQRLRDLSNGYWVLILDGVTDADVLLSTGGTNAATLGTRSARRRRRRRTRKGFWHRLSDVSHGSIIVTTEDERVVSALGIESGNTVSVRSMDQGQAISLLQKKLDGRQHIEPDCKELAAAEIWRSSLSVRAYLQGLKQDEASKQALFEWPSHHSQRDRSASDFIIAQQTHSHEHVEETPSRPEPHLRHSALIAEGKPDIFTMPQTVQVAVRHLLKTNGSSGNFISRFISWMSDNFPEAYYEHWDTCHHLYPLVQIMAEHLPADAGLLREWASVLCRCSRYAREQHWLDEALQMATESHKAALEVHDPTDELVLESEQYVGRILRDKGRHEEARVIFSRLWATCGEHLAPDDPLALTIGEDLAIQYSFTGNQTDALKLIQRIHGIRVAQKGPKGAHPTDVVGCDSNLGIILGVCRELSRAVEAFEAAIVKSREFNIVFNHPDMLTINSELATIYRDQKRFKKAESLFSDVLDGYKKTFGREHSLTVICKAELGTTYLHQRNWVAASVIYIEVVNDGETKRGEDHLETLEAKLKLARTYYEQGDFETAENQQRAVMETCKTKFGDKHLLTAESMEDLAFSLEQLGRPGEAIILAKECLETRVELLGPKHTDTAFIQDALTTWEKKYAAKNGSRKRDQSQPGEQRKKRGKYRS
ncbi:uncharacterized protein B0I36DRAFT_356667 [Microdochium trichocladiopsis]|uniref:NB-ARC domain-containing protein n=1 Tax=Microdochium trichocladiopsis TaxID=1682393 RepID=A0A9P9BH87_9PEZI|nr:uncharacterized protein B0I36DRAFT_356667 [Microdochium trichocladiopsis]KAH7009437.1 hypothetical protein B0I36DRAFT_356667 [Microdochium trichocladiopsis]